MKVIFIYMFITSSVVFGSAMAEPANSETPPLLVAKALQLCSEISLPNSMTRPEGFDLEAHLSNVRSQYMALVVRLSNPAGFNEVARVARTSIDELEIYCSLDIAMLTRDPRAKALLREYTGKDLPGLDTLIELYTPEMMQKPSSLSLQSTPNPLRVFGAPELARYAG